MLTFCVLGIFVYIMAIINCRECGREVSGKAKRCVHCGIKRPKAFTTINYLSGLFMFIVFAAVFHSCNQPSGPLTEQQRNNHMAYTCSYTIKETLNDPDSAKFDFDNAILVPRKDGNTGVILSISAKNAFNARIKAIYYCVIKETSMDNFETISIRKDL